MKTKKTIFIITIISSLLLFSVTLAFADETLIAKQDADYYVADQNIVVKTTITYADALTALGFRIVLPPNWSFVSVKGNSVPDVKPPVGVMGTLEFAWIKPPASPINIMCEFKVPSGERGEKQLSTTVLYRKMGQEIKAVAQPDPLIINQR